MLKYLPIILPMVLSACTSSSQDPFNFNNVQCTAGSSNSVTRRTNDTGESLAQEAAEYAIALKVGNPPQLIDAVVDTGSPYLVFLGEGVSCPVDKGAGVCVGHTFNPTASSSIVVTDLNATPAYGSAVVKEGRVYRDQVGLDCGQSVPNVSFIVASKANGLRNIFGLAYSTLESETGAIAGVNPLFRDLVDSGQMSNVFSLTLCGEQAPKGSNIELGGIDSRVQPADVVYTPIIKEDYYQIQPKTLQVQATGAVMGRFDKPVIMDSGTTFNIVSKEMFNALVTEMKKVSTTSPIPADFWDAATVGHPNFVANISSADVNRFPILVVTVPGMPGKPDFTLQISPQTYFKEFEDGKRAFGFRPADSNASYYIFGQVLMENDVVVFDRGEFPQKSGTGKIGFYSSNELCTT